MTTALALDEMGAGPPILFVHGLGAGGAEAWRAQWPLAERWHLRFARWPNAERTQDFEADAALIAAALGPGAHLVGHSYGAVAALLAAAQRPRATWSLLAIEPPASRAARGDPDVDAFEQAMRALHAAPPADPGDYLRAFLGLVDRRYQVPRLLTPEMAALAGHLRRRFRHPWEAEIPADTLMAATFPKLFISGGHRPAFETICDALALQIGGDRKVLRGAGHRPQDLGERFNAVVEAFVRALPLP